MRRRLSLLLAVAAGVLGCHAEPQPAPPAPPTAEFLAEAGDSTFWVQSGANGLHVRGSPITLARMDGRYYELYTAGDGVSYDVATFDWERLYRRDLLTGDSALVYDDSAPRRAAARWAAAHPEQSPLDDDEDAPSSPPLAVAGEVDLVAVHGPYASVEHRFSVERNGADAVASTRRLVVDLRTGEAVSLGGLFGAAAASEIERAGRRAFALAVDSVRHAPGPAAALARAALASIAFDPSSFTLRDAHGVPAIAFAAPGRGADGAHLLPVAPIATAAPDWWAAALAVLPASTPDSTSDIWTGAGYGVVATYEPSGTVTLALRDTLGREWPALRTGAPIERLYRLDTPAALGVATRHALARAFDEGALYPETARAVRWAPGSTPGGSLRHRSPRVRRASAAPRARIAPPAA